MIFFFRLIKILLILNLICNISMAEKSYQECDGNISNLTKFSIKHYKKVRKWTECFGKGVGPNGAIYIGEFKDGKFHGKGIYTHEGREYNGNWKKGKKFGFGVYTYSNGDRFEGNWIKSEYDNNGKYFYSNGEMYIGEWKKDKYHQPDNGNEKHGKGTFFYLNGDVYSGYWKNGLKHGKGILTRSDGTKIKGN